MFNKPYDQVTKADIEALIANAYPELRVVDYKRELPGKADKDKSDFLGDVTSFANAGGGFLLYGVGEEAGIPISAPGLVGNLDAEMLRLNSMVHTGTSPRMVLHHHPIDGFEQGPVLLVQIPMSWQPPHFVKRDDSFRCYTRDDTGKRPMDTMQIRAAFELSGTVQDRIRKFRDGRLARIIAGETCVTLPPAAKIIIHILPIVSFSRGFSVDPITIHKLSPFPMPLTGRGDCRYNLDGFLTYDAAGSSNSVCHSYCQTFRSAVIESVDTALFGIRDERRTIPSISFERRIIKSVTAYLKAESELQTPLPLTVLVTIVGVKGYEMAVDNVIEFDPTPIDRDVLVLPDVLVEDYGCDVPRTLRPLFDATWNATGFPRSLSYDDDGNWKPRR